MDRRSFHFRSIKSSAALAIGCSATSPWLHALSRSLASQNQTTDRILVVIQLSGGNDGLNTIVPIRDDLYFKARPKLAIAKSDTLNIDSETGLHPSLRGIAKLMESNRFCVVRGVGYPSPNRSHFESMDIWHSCQNKQARTKEGWLGKLDASRTTKNGSDVFGLHLGAEPLPLAMTARGVQTPSLSSADQMQWKATSPETDSNISNTEVTPESKNSLLDFVTASTSVARDISERLKTALSNPDASTTYPKTALAEKLKLVARLIAAGFSTRVYYLTLDGFDTHANQLLVHANLLRQWSDAIEAFHAHLQHLGHGDRVVAFTFSEFGRRVSENASLGTDHGAAAPVFFSGPSFPRLILGDVPDLARLDDGDLRYSIDFRSIYRSLIEDWLQLSSKNILGGDYAKVPGHLFS